MNQGSAQLDEHNQPRIPEAMKPHTVHWVAAMDNSEPWPRHEARGRATLYTAHNGRTALRLESGFDEHVPFASTIGDGAILLVDDGEQLLTMFSVGSHDGSPSPAYPEGHDPYMLFHLMTPQAGWSIGPRQAFHVRLSDWVA